MRYVKCAYERSACIARTGPTVAVGDDPFAVLA